LILRPFIGQIPPIIHDEIYTEDIKMYLFLLEKITFLFVPGVSSAAFLHILAVQRIEKILKKSFLLLLIFGVKKITQIT